MAGRKAQALSALLAALGLGSWASYRAGEQALEQWMQAHAPSVTLVQTILSARGYRVESEPERQHRALRLFPGAIPELPPVLSEPEAAPLLVGTLWVSSDRAWLLALGSDPLQGRLLGRTPEGARITTPPTWEPLGPSWRGLVRALELTARLTTLPQTERARPAANWPSTVAKPREWRDRRALVF